eukprot:snap_masked-scaffold_5-processed-gene-6.25-mRNA-1 protein AED:1.00 eAED:1.00 QI:0/-1/0/0/-1/1/1/0/362
MQEKYPESFCSTVASIYLNSVNLCIGVVSLILFSFTLVQTLVQGSALEALGEAGIVGPVVLSGVLFVTAIVGEVGLRKRKGKFFLIVYAMVIFALSSTFVVLGILFTLTVRNLNNTDGQASDTINGRIESRLNDFFIAVFNECCAFQFDSVEELLGCSDPQANEEACFTFEGTYTDALKRVQNSGLCNFLENRNIAFEGDQVPVVGDPEISPGSCANGDGVEFKEYVTEEFEQILVPIGITLLVLGVYLNMVLICTIVILCTERRFYDHLIVVNVVEDPKLMQELARRTGTRYSPQYPIPTIRQPSSSSPNPTFRSEYDDGSSDTEKRKNSAVSPRRSSSANQQNLHKSHGTQEDDPNYISF